MNDLISVIIPVYKVEKYVSRCVDSVLSQTYQNLEIFLVDDGSPDRCGQICDRYAEKDRRIKVIHKENGGLSDARNAALDVCTGEYISFIDSDDYVSDDFIESMVQAILKHHTLLAICGINKFDELGNIAVDYAPSATEKCVTGREMMETVWRPAACNKLYHRSLFSAIRFPFGKLYEDMFIYHDILSKVDRVSFTGKNSYYYFSRQSSIMNKKYDIRNTDSVEALDLRINKLREMGYKDLADRQLSFLFNQTVEAFSRLDRSDSNVKARLRSIKAVFNRHYRDMVFCTKFSSHQKVKISLFRFFPSIFMRLSGSGI